MIFLYISCFIHDNPSLTLRLPLPSPPLLSRRLPHWHIPSASCSVSSSLFTCKTEVCLYTYDFFLPLTLSVLVSHSMSQLNLYAVPYTRSQAPSELVPDVEIHSDTTAFNTGLNNRDMFHGKRRCVVCGERSRHLLERCHIIGRKDLDAVCHL